MAGGDTSKVLEFAGFRLDRARRELAGPDGQAVDLKPKVFDTLCALAERPGQLMDKAALMDAVWPGVVVEENNLNQAISALRKALGDDADRRMIVTVPGRGYQFTPAVTEQYEQSLPSPTAPTPLAPSPTPPDPPAGQQSQPASPRMLGLPRRALILAAILVLAGLVAGFSLLGRFGRPALEPTIAVLPFANLSGNPGQDYLARGFAVEVIEHLSQLDGMEVISRNSSFTFGPDADAREVGRNLHVAHVLSGTVRGEGGRLAIKAELVDAQRGRVIWTQSYESSLTATGLDQVQRRIAAKISGAMSIAFDVDKKMRPSGSGTQSLEAYDLYLQALDQWWYHRNAQLSADLFARAIELDPNYADAWAGRAIAIASSWSTNAIVEARANFASAYGMAQRAIELDPDLSRAQAIFGAISTTQGKWDEADAAIRRALEIARTDMALNHRQMLLLRTGHIAEAHEVMLEIDQVDPLRLIDIGPIFIRASLGRHDELKDILSQEDWANSSSLVRRGFALSARIHAKDPPASVRQGLEAIAQRPERAPAEFASAVLAVFDDREKARAVLRSWYEDEGFQHFLKWDLIPHLAAWYGDTDLVLRVWREEFPVTNVRTAYVWAPAFADARSRPEFKALMREIGLVDYWRVHGWPDKCQPVGADDFECG